MKKYSNTLRSFNEHPSTKKVMLPIGETDGQGHPPTQRKQLIKSWIICWILHCLPRFLEECSIKYDFIWYLKCFRHYIHKKGQLPVLKRLATSHKMHNLDVCSNDWQKKDSAFLSIAVLHFIVQLILLPHDLNDSKWSQMTSLNLLSTQRLIWSPFRSFSQQNYL